MTKKFDLLNLSYKTSMIENQDLLKKVTEVQSEKSILRNDIEGENFKVSSIEKEILVKSENLNKLLNKKEFLESYLFKIKSKTKKNETTIKTFKENYIVLQLLAA